MSPRHASAGVSIGVCLASMLAAAPVGAQTVRPANGDFETACRSYCSGRGQSYVRYEPSRMRGGATCVCAAAPAAPDQICALEAGPLKNADEARAKCPTVCPAPSTWNQAWRSTVPDKMATCDCVTRGAPVGRTCLLEAGPIWNGDDAKQKCPKVCVAPAVWTNAWSTSVWGKMSICECVNR